MLLVVFLFFNRSSDEGEIGRCGTFRVAAGDVAGLARRGDGPVGEERRGPGFGGVSDEDKKRGAKGSVFNIFLA